MFWERQRIPPQKISRGETRHAQIGTVLRGHESAELCGDRQAMAMLQHEVTKLTKDTKERLLATSHEIIGAAIEVHRWLGPGLLESVYEAALCKELRLRGG
jgi:hypothetical protein